jgi:hypothetical protein
MRGQKLALRQQSRAAGTDRDAGEGNWPSGRAGEGNWPGGPWAKNDDELIC